MEIETKMSNLVVSLIILTMSLLGCSFRNAWPEFSICKVLRRMCIASVIAGCKCGKQTGAWLADLEYIEHEICRERIILGTRQYSRHIQQRVA